MSKIPSRADMRTPLARVEGLGSGHSGTQHFLHQRISAVALTGLSIWFVAVALYLVRADYPDVLAFLSQPHNAILMALFMATALYHMSLGLQIIIEDYFHQEGMKFVLLILNRFFIWSVGAAAGYAILKIAF